MQRHPPRRQLRGLLCPISSSPPASFACRAAPVAEDDAVFQPALPETPIAVAALPRRFLNQLWNSYCAAHFCQRKSSLSHVFSAFWTQRLSPLLPTQHQNSETQRTMSTESISNSYPVHRCEQARLVKAFKAFTCHAEAQLRVDATAKAHGEPVVMQGSDLMSLMDQFRAKYGDFLHDKTLPSQSYYGASKKNSRTVSSKRKRWLTHSASKKKRANAPNDRNPLGSWPYIWIRRLVVGSCPPCRRPQRSCATSMLSCLTCGVATCPTSSTPARPLL